MGYVLESGSQTEQWRYQRLQERLQKIGYDRHCGVPKVVDRRENIDLCESQILDMFWDSAPISGPKIREQMMYLGHRRSTSQKSLKGLCEKGILCLIDRQYRLIDSPTHPLELGAPIVFLPGTKSQKIGHIVELKKLKQGKGGIHPIAALSNGQTMFVNPETAKVDLSQKAKEDHSDWLMMQLSEAVDKNTAVSAAEICLKAFQDGIPQVSTAIKDAVRSGIIRRGRKRAPFGFITIESVYWRNV